MTTPTIAAHSASPVPPAIRRPAGSRWSWSFLIDLFVFLFVLAAIFGVYAIGHTWLGPVPAQADISQNPRDIPLYAFYSLVRISVAYVLSLGFALAYGYVAARSKQAELVLIPLLDILQSIPVLSFLPGVMLAMVALFPHSQLGIELGSIILIFTGQVWNIAFSFYSSLKSIPRELREAAIIYRFGSWRLGGLGRIRVSDGWRKLWRYVDVFWQLATCDECVADHLWRAIHGCDAGADCFCNGCAGGYDDSRFYPAASEVVFPS